VEGSKLGSNSASRTLGVESTVVGRGQAGVQISPLLCSSSRACPLEPVLSSQTNPLRAGMVTDPADYRWSSFPHHGLGRADPLVSGFPEWEELGATEAQRRRRWRAKVRGVQDEAELAAVRTSLRSGRPLGTDDWTGRVAERLNIDLKPRPRGRPPKEK
jgi:hypothetical protein